MDQPTPILSLNFKDRLKNIEGTLNKAEQDEAITAGTNKRGASAQMQSKKIGGLSELETNVAGEVGERCGSKGLRIPYKELLNVFKKMADAGYAGKQIDFRTSLCQAPNDRPVFCIGRPGDCLEPDRIWVGIWLYGTRGPKFCLPGWAYGHEIQAIGKWGSPNGDKPYCWMVRHYHMRNIMELFYLLHPEVPIPGPQPDSHGVLR